MRKYIVLSVNQNVDYLYFLPLTIWTWEKTGWEVLVFYRGEKRDGHAEILSLNYSELVFDLDKIDGIRDATIAQTSRLYAGCLNSIEYNDYIMLGDVDMLALSDAWKPDYTNLTVYNHDLTGFGEIPMCYVGAPKSIWNEFMKLDGLGYNEALKRDVTANQNSKSDDFYKWWGVDQQTLTARLNEYGKEKITFVNRGQSTHGFARGRVDRGSGGWVLDQPELIDAHLMQQTHHSQEKIDKLMQLLRHVWPQEDFTWFERYTEEFKKLAV
jgi:hypothetical protein